MVLGVILGPGEIVALAASSTRIPGRYAYRRLSLLTNGKILLPVEKNTGNVSDVGAFDLFEHLG